MIRTRPPVASPATRTAAVEKSGNNAPNPALPLRSLLGTELVDVDGATLELGLTDEGFERTLVLPNGNSQKIAFSFANGPVGTVSDGDKAIGVFRARSEIQRPIVCVPVVTTRGTLSRSPRVDWLPARP